jgi:hypothetical protein
MRKYIWYVNENWKLHDEIMEEEINPLDVHVKKDGKGKYPMFD